MKITLFLLLISLISACAPKQKWVHKTDSNLNQTEDLSYCTRESLELYPEKITTKTIIKYEKVASYQWAGNRKDDVYIPLSRKIQVDGNLDDRNQAIKKCMDERGWKLIP